MTLTVKIASMMFCTLAGIGSAIRSIVTVRPLGSPVERYRQQNQVNSNVAKRIIRFRANAASLEITYDGFFVDWTDYYTPEGAVVNYSATNFETVARAQKQEESEIDRLGRITERGPKKDPSGQVVGERIAGIYQQASGGRRSGNTVMWTRGSNFAQITSESLPVLLEFEKLVTSVKAGEIFQWSTTAASQVREDEANRPANSIKEAITFTAEELPMGGVPRAIEGNPLQIAVANDENVKVLGTARSWKASDGARITVYSIDLLSSTAASQYLGDILRDARIVKRKPIANEKGETVGERIVAYVSVPVDPKGSDAQDKTIAIVIRTDHTRLCQASSESLDAILALERYLDEHSSEWPHH